MSENHDFQDHGLDLIRRVLRGDETVEAFCAAYERAWNFDRIEDRLTAAESRIYEQLFDIVVWYSPIDEDRRANPSFKDEAEILEAASHALRALQRDH